MPVVTIHVEGNGIYLTVRQGSSFVPPGNQKALINLIEAVLSDYAMLCPMKPTTISVKVTDYNDQFMKSGYS